MGVGLPLTPSAALSYVRRLSEGDIEAVKAMSSVEAVYPVRMVPRPKAVNDIISVVAGPVSNPTDTYIPHRMTGVDKLHNMGIYGKGVLVAEIDTGVECVAIPLACLGAHFADFTSASSCLPLLLQLHSPGARQRLLWSA